MSAPVVMGRQTTDDASGPFDIALPAGVTAGELLIVATQGNAGGTNSGPVGWSTLYVDGVGCLVLAKIAAGGEATVTITAGGAGDVIGKSWRITGQLGVIIPAASGTTAVSITPDPPSLTAVPSGPDLLWIAFGCNKQAQGFTGFPAGYGDTEAFGGSSSPRLGTAELTTQTNPEDPGSFTIANSTEWSAVTIGVTGSFAMDAIPTRIMGYGRW